MARFIHEERNQPGRIAWGSVALLAAGLVGAGCHRAPPVGAPSPAGGDSVDFTVPQVVDTATSDADPGPLPRDRSTDASPERALVTCIEGVRAQSGSDGPDGELYGTAFAAEQQADYPLARRRYFEVVERYPRSPAVPLAYLGFGELFLREGVDDPSKFPLAEAAYTEVLKYPPPANRVYFYASLRQGDARRASDPRRADAAYQKVERDLTAGVDAPCSAELVQVARQRIAVLLAPEGPR